MKRILLTLLILATFSLAAPAQDVSIPDDTEKFVAGFRYLMRSGPVYYYINDSVVSRQNNKIAFYGFYFIDRKNYGLSKAVIDCFGFTWFELDRIYYEEGVRKYGTGYRAFSINTGSAAAKAHRMLCGVTT